LNKKIETSSATLPKILSELTHSNQFLKLFSVFCLLVTTLALGTTAILVTKDPLVLSLSPKGEKLENSTIPKPEDEIKTAISFYLDKRYKWEPSSAKKNITSAEAFVLPTSLKVFQSGIANVVKFSIERNVSQRIYTDTIEVALDKKTALITGDRVTSIQGIKAAGNLRLELSIEFGPRTVENPWGVYITKEREL
jgi:hypothetical protein